MTTIEVSTWGRSGVGDIRVRVPEGDAATEAVGRSIERRTGLSVVTCRADGSAVSGGRVTSHHYQCTLGRALRSGGYSVEGEIWFAVPVQS